MPEAGSIDLVIVGAGAAGLGAARAALDRGLSFAVFEATSRIGGRAHTVTTPFGVPWDRGCHWLHSADVNPFTPLADAYGFRYRSEPTQRRIRLGDRWADDAEQAAARTAIDSGLRTAAAAGHDGRDVPVTDSIDGGSPWIAQLRAVFAAEWGVAAENVSTTDYARYRDTGTNWPVEDGYGALVVRHAAGLPVALRTPVDRIDWGGPGVRVTTARGTVTARAAIVTVSTGVLAAETIRFEPALPDRMQEAIAAVPLGSANKVALQIEGRRLGVEGHTYASIPIGDGTVVGVELRPFGRDLASLYLAGPLGAELEHAGDAATVDAAVGALRDALGSNAVREVGATACTAWGREPTIRGAYAAARPGQSHRRADLALPLEDRLFLAGEATSPDFYSTCHGAHLSGVAAVAEATAALGRG
ncbi:MAG: hypothetical protein AVDCRST_MAG19-2277 [uncultured Thermomicrobiales bacterium]|uniref:Tryptophan 2-monooxygenase n=1 Tax=uncultured Thermomicrobiales bacterium TaxID=1645740 RepID=A0A6J4V1U8_9BACT|nr:MAG: hypothetical protein AVDCRST_MAG19-2277 [uncultured Thermomicrobiales bacterium]